MSNGTILTLTTTTVFAASASAGIIDAHGVIDVATAEDLGGASIFVDVQDLDLAPDDAADLSRRIHDMNLTDSAKVEHFQNVAGTDWSAADANGSIDDPARRLGGLFDQVTGREDSLGLNLLIDPFAYVGDFNLTDSNLETNWNEDLGTPGDQAELIVPGPAGLAFLSLAGLIRERRRR
jgi:hypothetical protein